MKRLTVEQRAEYNDTLKAGEKPPNKYLVQKVTNSVQPCIYDVLTPEQLDVYCESELWEVVIT